MNYKKLASQLSKRIAFKEARKMGFYDMRAVRKAEESLFLGNLVAFVLLPLLGLLGILAAAGRI